MKISSVVLIAASISIGFSSAHASESPFAQSTAQSILETLQNKANHLTSDETAALAQLNAARDNQANADTNWAAQTLLTKSFQATFVQTDNIQLPIQTAEPIFGSGDRDLYTFCPNGTEVRRHLATYLDFDGTVKPAWGYPYCVSSADTSATPAPVSGELNVQQLWVSNWKHPVLTLVIEGGNFKNNLDLDLNDLISGKVSEAQVMKALQ